MPASNVDWWCPECKVSMRFDDDMDVYHCGHCGLGFSEHNLLEPLLANGERIDTAEAALRIMEFVENCDRSELANVYGSVFNRQTVFDPETNEIVAEK